jgi:peptidoglycan/LPS O-acetylase OafA/YrhL
MRQSIRLVDMGIDVAWDLFIGTSLIFLCFALAGDARFGLRWAIPGAVLGFVLIVLNVSTFPWPPNTRGLFDIGPAVGVFIIALSLRLLQLGIRRGEGVGAK